MDNRPQENYTIEINDRNVWKTLGPGGGGALFHPVVSPHDPETVMTATDMTGAFITHDGGKCWEQVNLKTRVDAFAFDPMDPMIIYAGSSGIFRSEDGGKAWKLIFPKPEHIVEEISVGDEADHYFISDDTWPGGETGSPRINVCLIKIDPGNSRNIFAGLYSAGLQIFNSTDGGESWSELFRVTGKQLFDFYIDTGSPVDNRTLFVFADSGIYRVMSGRSGEVRELKLPQGIKTLAGATCGWNPDAGRAVFYISGEPDESLGDIYGGLWKSVDMGNTWEDLTPRLADLYENSETGLIRFFNHTDACENKAGFAYMACYEYPRVSKDPWGDITGYGILKTEDEGSTWKWVLKGSKYEDPANKKPGWVERDYDGNWHWIGPKGSLLLGLGTGPSNPDVCYATDLGSAYRTVDGGKTWEQVYSGDHADKSVSSRGLDVTTCYGVHFDPFDKKHLAISYTDIGLFHSFNGGITWRHAINGIDMMWANTCYWLEFDPDVKGRAWGAWAFSHDLPRTKMFRLRNLGTKPGGIARSEDGLKTWIKSNSGLPESSTVTHIVLDPASPVGERTLYAAVFTKGVYKSTDDGFTWKLKNNGLGPNLNAWRLIMSKDGSIYLLVARDIEDRPVIFGSSTSKGFDCGEKVDGAVYRSTDGGDSWIKLGLPEGVNAPNDLAVNPQDPKKLYLACWPRTMDGREHYGGVCMSADGGLNWSCIFDPKSHVYGITIDEGTPSTLYFNTFDGFACRSDDGGGTWKRLKGYNFKWGHRVIIDPYDTKMLYLTTFGGSVLYGPSSIDEG